MKSISKIIALLGMIAMLFTMVGCPNANAGGGENPQPTAPKNNFKGKYFVGTLENGSEFGYAYFSDKSDKDVTLKITDALIDCSYTFNEDVATITGTYEGNTVTLTTTKLENNKFSITYSKDLTGTENDIVVTYTKATKPSTDPYSGKFFAGYIVETDDSTVQEETPIMYFDFESTTVTPYWHNEGSLEKISDALAFTVDSKDLTDVKVTVNWVYKESLEITSMGYDAEAESFKAYVPASLLNDDAVETFTIEFRKITRPEIPEVEEPVIPYTVTFANPTDGHTATVSEEGVITITLAEKAAGGEWDNQIFIKGVNGDTIVPGAKICTSFTVTSSIDMPNFYVKNHFADEGGPGIDKSVPLTAEVATEVKIYGIVSDTYNAEQEKFLIALRDNMVAGATIKLSNLKTEVLEDYSITNIVLTASTLTISAGENITLSAVDQYGFGIADATYEISGEDTTGSTISGNVLTTGTTAGTVTVVAKKDDLTSETVEITITADKDYAKYFKVGSQTAEKDLAVKGYMALWYVADAGWNCGDVVTITEASATENSYSVTRETTGTNTWSTQMFYKEELGKYDISFKVKSTTAGQVVINGETISLEADTAYNYSATKELKVSEENKDTIQTLIKIEIGKDLPAGTFTITDFSVTPAASE